MAKPVLLLLIMCTITSNLDGASYVNRRNTPGEKLLLHRKVTQAPCALFKTDLITYPEITDSPRIRLITGIEMIDLQPKQGSTARVILGGVNFPFVTIKICNVLNKGYSYDVKIFGVCK